MILLVCGHKRTTCSNQQKNSWRPLHLYLAHPAPLLRVWCVQRSFALLFYTSEVSRHQGQAKADTNQGPVVLGVFVIYIYIHIYMTLSVIFYLSVILSILCLCSEFGAVNGILHCFFCASVVSSYQGQAKADTNQGPTVLVPWPVVLGAYC